jgi:hypothetical protein
METLCCHIPANTEPTKNPGLRGRAIDRNNDVETASNSIRINHRGGRDKSDGQIETG